MQLKHFPLALGIALAVMRSAPAQQATTQSYFSGQRLVTRADVSRAYLELERTVHDHPPADDAERARINKSFDDATTLFFQRDLSGTVKMINELIVSLRLDDRSRIASAQLVRA